MARWVAAGVCGTVGAWATGGAFDARLCTNRTPLRYGLRMLIHTDLDAARRILETTRTIAVLGAHPDTDRAAYYVPDYLHGRGYRVFPVNPTKVGQKLWGEPVVASLPEVSAAHGAIDMVDVFRPSDALAGHVDEILKMTPLPKVVWFQLGIRDDAVARTLVDAGIDVVQSRCALADHRAFGLGDVRPTGAS